MKYVYKLDDGRSVFRVRGAGYTYRVWRHSPRGWGDDTGIWREFYNEITTEITSLNARLRGVEVE